MQKILVTPRSFGKGDPEPCRMLESAGYQVVMNTTGGILQEDQLKSLLEDCTGVIIGVDPLTPSIVESAPQLKAVAKYGVGVDNIPLEVCAQRGIKVSRTVGANAAAVADYAMALMLAVARQVVTIDQGCRHGDWGKRTAIDVYGATLGLLGMGAIGRGVAERARGFNMRVLAHDVCWDADFAEKTGVQRASFDDIVEGADFISLHLPLIPETRNIIDASAISRMKPNAVLINTARGGLVDEEALLDALRRHRIYGAGIDAFCHEPLDNPEWYALDNVVIGSHAAASTLGATREMGRMAAANLLRDLGQH